MSEVFLTLGLPRSALILDVACGVGNVAADLRDAGYHRLDGMDPVRGYLETAAASGLYRQTFPESIDPDRPTSLQTGEYDAVVCSAGFFQGLISPRALKELLRVAKKGGKKIHILYVDFSKKNSYTWVDSSPKKKNFKHTSVSQIRKLHALHKTVVLSCGTSPTATRATGRTSPPSERSSVSWWTVESGNSTGTISLSATQRNILESAV